jgi:putative phosphoserine phosphatase/1-acylglycerol-3-phosphate O-acyltransferase
VTHTEGAPLALHAALTRHVKEMPVGPKVAAFFDLDRTLLAGFSATAFFRERLLSGRMTPREMGESFLGALSFALGRTGFSGLMAASTAAYRGLAERVLVELGEEVFEKHLAVQIYPESRALVRAHQQRGHTVAIVSSATRYQVDPLARDLGIEHVLCTRLEVEDGVFTGRVVHPTCWGEGKAIAARDFTAGRDVDLGQSSFYTDSADDLPLLEIVGDPRPLNPDRRLTAIAAERGWPVRRFESRGRPGLSALVRTGLAYGSLIPSVLGGAAAGLLNGSRRQAVNLVTTAFGELGTAAAGIDLQVEGEEHLWSRRPAVFIFNHQSGVDMLLVMKLLRRDVVGVAKRELQSHPIFGPLFSFGGIVFVDRAGSDREKAIAALAPAVDALSRGLSIAIAPEGTRSRTPRLGPFKKGAFHIAMAAKVPIVPIVFRNALDALPRGAALVRPATVEALVLPPIDTADWSPEFLDDHIRAIRERYLAVLEEG